MMEHFVITISRGSGCGGRILGGRLATALGIPCYDSDILRMASEISGIDEKLFEKSDERVSLSFWKRKGSGDGELIAPNNGGFLSEENRFRYQAYTLRELAKLHSFVAIGRAANYILEGFPNHISVAVRAPLDYCIPQVMQQRQLDRAEAENWIRKTDKMRQEHYAYYTGGDWNDPKNFDIILNPAKIDLETSVEIIRLCLDSRMAKGKA